MYPLTSRLLQRAGGWFFGLVSSGSLPAILGAILNNGRNAMKKFIRGVLICSALLLIPAGVANANFKGGPGHHPGGSGHHPGLGHQPGGPGQPGPGHQFGGPGQPGPGHHPSGFGPHPGGPGPGPHPGFGGFPHQPGPGFGHPLDPIGHGIGGGLHILGHGLNALDPFYYGSPYVYGPPYMNPYPVYNYSSDCPQILGLASRGLVPPGVPPEHFFMRVNQCGGGFGPSYFPPAAGIPFAPVPAPGAY